MAINDNIHRNLKAALKEIHLLAGTHDIEVPQISVALRTGDTPSHVRQSMLRHSPHILITTPESLYLLIGAHKTTLVFAGMRAQTEKVARDLNQLRRQITSDPAAQLALAHHGSISREARYSIEARLKAGNIPAVIATASLELGIDIGSIDLVVHLEAPRSVSGALQRVGRTCL
jgi:ATP-dependent Lhr-like helicase